MKAALDDNSAASIKHKGPALWEVRTVEANALRNQTPGVRERIASQGVPAADSAAILTADGAFLFIAWPGSHHRRRIFAGYRSHRRNLNTLGRASRDQEHRFRNEFFGKFHRHKPLHLSV